jgi:hypothetical protein
MPAQGRRQTRRWTGRERKISENAAVASIQYHLNRVKREGKSFPGDFVEVLTAAERVLKLKLFGMRELNLILALAVCRLSLSKYVK